MKKRAIKKLLKKFFGKSYLMLKIKLKQLKIINQFVSLQLKQATKFIIIINEKKIGFLIKIILIKNLLIIKSYKLVLTLKSNKMILKI